MKKLLLSVSLIISSAAFAQTAFWTETFGTGCNRGQTANGFATVNGPWTQTSTGTNDAYADLWCVSGTATGEGAQNCSDNCITNSTADNQSLHVANAAIAIVNFGADTGSTYLTGTFCGAGICSTTHKRIESPSVNTVNRDSVGISFLYYEGGEFMGDEATLWYSADNGTTWTMINQLAKVSASCAAPSGLWTEFSMLLPASASNNAVGIKIAFEWVNDNDGVGTDPSFAVDDVTLLENMPLSVAQPAPVLISLVSHENSVSVNAQEPWKVLSIVDVSGREIQVNTVGNEINFAQAASVYFIRMEMNGVESVHRVVLAQ